jgi:hypothetical protein
MDIQTQRDFLSAALDEGIMDFAELSAAIEEFCKKLKLQAIANGLKDLIFIGLYIIQNGPQPATDKGKALFYRIVSEGTSRNKQLRDMGYI